MSEQTATATTAATAVQTATPTPQPSEAPALSPEKAEIKRLTTEHERRVRENIMERRKYEAQLKELSPKAQKGDEYEKLIRRAKLDPLSVVHGIWGEKGWDILTGAKIGDTAPANIIQAEMDRMRDEVRSEFSTRDATAKAQQEAAEKASVQNAFDGHKLEMARFFAASKAEYPALEERFGGNPRAVGDAIHAHIVNAFNTAHAAATRDGNQANVTAMTPRQAADALEEVEAGFAQRLAKHEKYAPKFREALTPKPMSNTMGGPKLQPSQSSQGQSQSNQLPQTRRTLSNDITGSTPGRQPPANLEERRRRAIERYNEVRRR